MVDKLVGSDANRKRIEAVEAAFGTSGKPLQDVGRVLVGEGVLTKMCRKKPKPRQFFLFNDILVYGNIVLNKRMYNKQHIIPLEQVRLRAIDDDPAKPELRNGWYIESASKSFAVYAATATEKSEWMAHINKCVTDVIARDGRKRPDAEAPIWVPDSDATVCMLCNKSAFTVINRRHHCRHCGKVVCGNCSNKKFLLPEQSSKPLRVCSTCYDDLTSGKATEKPPVVESAPKNKLAFMQGASPTEELPSNAAEATLNNQDTSGDDSDSDDDIEGAPKSEPTKTEYEPTVFFAETSQSGDVPKLDQDKSDNTEMNSN